MTRKLIIVYNGPYQEYLERQLESLMKADGWTLVASGYNMIKSMRDMRWEKEEPDVEPDVDSGD